MKTEEGLFWFRRFINLSLTYLLRHLPTYLQPRDPHRAEDARILLNGYLWCLQYDRSFSYYTVQNTVYCHSTQYSLLVQKSTDGNKHKYGDIRVYS